MAGPDFSSGTLRYGDSFELTYTKKGIYRYYCSIHSAMEGVVVVGDKIIKEIADLLSIIPDYKNFYFIKKIFSYSQADKSKDFFFFQLTFPLLFLSQNRKSFLQH